MRAKISGSSNFPEDATGVFRRCIQSSPLIGDAMRQTPHIGASGHKYVELSIKRVSPLVCLAICLILYSSVCNGQQNPSPILKAFIDKAYQTYVVPNGWDYSLMVKQIPGQLAMVFGSALRQQMRYATDATSRQAMSSLVMDIREYLKGVAAECGYVDMRGNPVTGEALWKLCRQYVTGENEFFKNNPGFKVLNMTSVLATPRQAGTSQSHEEMLDEEAIELMNIVAPPPSDPPKIKPEPPPRARVFQPENISGNWFHCEDRGCLELNIRAEGNGSFVGTLVSYDGGPDTWGWPKGVPVFHVTFVQINKNLYGTDTGMSFSGKYLQLTGSDRNIATWFDLNIDYKVSLENEESIILNTTYLLSYRNPKRR
jgi:hypothetical protein